VGLCFTKVSRQKRLWFACSSICATIDSLSLFASHYAKPRCLCCAITHLTVRAPCIHFLSNNCKLTITASKIYATPLEFTNYSQFCLNVASCVPISNPYVLSKSCGTHKFYRWAEVVSFEFHTMSVSWPQLAKWIGLETIILQHSWNEQTG